MSTGNTQKSKRKKNTSQSDNPTLIDKLNSYFEPRLDTWFYILLILSGVLCLVFFDPKVSIGGDDSEYLNRAFKFIKNGKFPTFQGPLYPMFIGLIMSISGLKLLLFKFFSVIFMLVHFWLTYKVFRKYLPAFLMIFLLFILSINVSILNYASSTYTEAFFLMIQSIFLYVFDKHFLTQLKPRYSIAEDYKKFLLLGFMIFLLTITKNIGLAAIIAVCLFFLIKKRWLAIVYTILAFVLFQGTFFAAKKYVWDVDQTQISNQGSTLTYKHPYDKSQGKEDFSGYVNRFVVNSNKYLSKHFYIFNGLIKEKFQRGDGNSLLTIIMYAIFITGFIFFFNKSDFWTFAAVYIAVCCGVTFVVLQTYWDQERLIMVFIPLILAYLFYAIYYLIYNYQPKLSWFVVTLCALFMITNSGKTLNRLPKTIDNMQHYLQGDLLYGFTPDWINYFKMSKWAINNLPESAYVGCRKPGMAFIYSRGHEFYGIWNVPSSQDPEELYNKLKENGVTHVIMASLRVDPTRNTGRTISTIRRYLKIVHSQYPGSIKLVHKIGETEPAFLYEVK